MNRSLASVHSCVLVVALAALCAHVARDVVERRAHASAAAAAAADVARELDALERALDGVVFAADDGGGVESARNVVAFWTTLVVDAGARVRATRLVEPPLVACAEARATLGTLVRALAAASTLHGVDAVPLAHAVARACAAYVAAANAADPPCAY